MANKIPQETIEEFKVRGDELVGKVKELIEEGNASRVQIQKDGKVLMELPLTWGVGGAVAALFMSPVLAAVGALAALVAEVTLVVQHDGEGRLIEPGATADQD